MSQCNMRRVNVSEVFSQNTSTTCSEIISKCSSAWNRYADSLPDVFDNVILFKYDDFGPLIDRLDRTMPHRVISLADTIFSFDDVLLLTQLRIVPDIAVPTEHARAPQRLRHARHRSVPARHERPRAFVPHHLPPFDRPNRHRRVEHSMRRSERLPHPPRRIPPAPPARALVHEHDDVLHPHARIRGQPPHQIFPSARASPRRRASASTTARPRIRSPRARASPPRQVRLQLLLTLRWFRPLGRVHHVRALRRRRRRAIRQFTRDDERQTTSDKRCVHA